MLKIVREADPKETARFVKEAPPSVVAAMRQTVSSLVGTLPPAYFDVKVNSVRPLTWHGRQYRRHM